jgi:3-methyladenine DNA glycosylase Tag
MDLENKMQWCLSSDLYKKNDEEWGNSGLWRSKNYSTVLENVQAGLSWLQF